MQTFLKFAKLHQTFLNASICKWHSQIILEVYHRERYMYSKFILEASLRNERELELFRQILKQRIRQIFTAGALV